MFRIRDVIKPFGRPKSFRTFGTQGAIGLLGTLLTVFSPLFLLTFWVSYMHNQTFPDPLSGDEEAHFLKILKESPDKLTDRMSILNYEEALQKLVEHNLRLVAFIVKRYETSNQEGEDLFSIGVIGLIKGIKSFKPEKGVKLSTYVTRCIDNEILMELRVRKKDQGIVSLYRPIGIDKEGNELTLLDVIMTEQKDFLRIENESVYQTVLEKLKTLPPREREIILMRYGANRHPQREIGKKLGISRSYVSRIEQKILEMFKKELVDGDELNFE